MSIALVTGSSGLIGSQAVSFFAEKGLDVIGLDNDMRRQFFGDSASTSWLRDKLIDSVPNYRHLDLDIRDTTALEALFKEHGDTIKAIIHCAAQPSHEWAAGDPFSDFSVNANGTLK